MSVWVAVIVAVVVAQLTRERREDQRRQATSRERHYAACDEFAERPSQRPSDTSAGVCPTSRRRSAPGASPDCVPGATLQHGRRGH